MKNMQNHPLRILLTFLENEKKKKESASYKESNFVGYAIKVTYDTVTVITSEPFKLAVGGVPQNSLLIMVPINMESTTPHFTLLRVNQSAPTPLDQHQQETYFALHKNSMPELDIFTQSDLQWGALETNVLGMFYPSPDKSDVIEFSHDMNNFVSAHKYRIYYPNDELLDLIINSLVSDYNTFNIGILRLTECRLQLPNKPLPNVSVNISTKDFMGTRTAMFGKTRFGKSNIIKLIAQSIMETTKKSNNVGQLIFDIDGEYANDNPQDDNSSIRSIYPDDCTVYALSQKKNTPSKQLRLNFYEYPDASHRILSDLLDKNKRCSAVYIRNFSEVEIPSLESITDNMDFNEQIRNRRKILLYWAILHKAGYDVNATKLAERFPSGLDPKYKDKLRKDIHGNAPAPINSLDDLLKEYEAISKFLRKKERRGEGDEQEDEVLSDSGRPLFDTDDKALLEFLEPRYGRSGTRTIQEFRRYHAKNAGDFIKEILDLLDVGKTIILDLSNSDTEVRRYFSTDLSEAIYHHQVEKFTSNSLIRDDDGINHYIQLYFEEAHNLFPAKEVKEDIYTQIAKEGAKCNIGMVYSTQSVTSIHADLLNQTENFFILHLSSQYEVQALSKINFAFDKFQNDILQSKTPGYARILTRSHKFVVPVQAKKFKPIQKEAN
jgi:hypothetical protein